MKVKRGDVVYLKHETAPDGHIQAFTRPYLVVSNDIGNAFSTICLLVPMTRQHRNLSQPTHAVIKFGESMMLCEQIITANQGEIKEIVAHIDRYDEVKINNCLRVSLEV